MTARQLVYVVAPALTLTFALALASCNAREDEPAAVVSIGSIAQGLDTDSDGMDDAWETTYFGNLSQTAAGDFDSDGMTNLEEHTHSLNPAVANAFEDADGDRYPNIFEIKNSSNPQSSASTPTPQFTVDGTGGGTHTTVNAALTAANVANGAYQIIGIAPGTYAGASNVGLTFPTSKPKFLLIGLQGAAKTILDGGGTSTGWTVNNAAVIASLTFKKATNALVISLTGEVRLVDLLVRDNANAVTTAAGVHVYGATSLHILGSTFLDNTTGPSSSSGNHIYIGSGATTLRNTAVWGQASTTMLAKAGGATLTTTYSFVKGQTLTGTGNLAGLTNPKLRPDGHILWDSPLRAAGQTLAQSLVDMDGEARPGTTPDMGVDQFVDTDTDDLADIWEIAEATNLTTLTSRTQDQDSDGLTNEEEHANSSKPTVYDTDGDGLSDGDEVHTYSSSPTSTDTDLDGMPDGWEISHGLAANVANALDDADGDRYPNIFEYARSTDPSDIASKPTANYTVDATGGGTHTTLSAAISAADVVNGAYQIIGIAPGTYLGGVGLSTAKPKFLLIGLQGAAKTVIEGPINSVGLTAYNTAVIASLTFRKSVRPIYVAALTTSEVRLVDLIVRDNGNTTSYAAGLHVDTAKEVHVVGSTFLNNSGFATAKQIYIGGSAAGKLTNTVVWGQATGTMLAKASGATLTTNYCLVKGQTLTGTGNLSGATDPLLRTDARLRSTSPLRGVAGSTTQSRVDMDNDVRPTSAADIGADQYNDADTDGLSDGWEIASFGSTSAVAGSADDDSDGLTNLEEYDLESDRLVADTDGDGVKDGLEVAQGMNPIVADSDDVATDLNHDGLIDSIGVQLGHPPDELDDDGDSVSNEDEVLVCTDPFRADSDGDGVTDDVDPFPWDPLKSALTSDPYDVTAPVITLTAPWYAVEQ